MARPKKASIEKRSEQLKIRLTMAEIEYVRSVASSNGINISDYARRRMLGVRLPVKTLSHTDPALISELNAIGNNVNQLTRSVHRGSDFADYWYEVGQELEHVLKKVLIKDGT